MKHVLGIFMLGVVVIISLVSLTNQACSREVTKENATCLMNNYGHDLDGVYLHNIL